MSAELNKENVRIVVFKKPLIVVAVSASLAVPVVYGVIKLIQLRTAESILTAAVRRRGADPSFIPDVVSRVSRADPGLAADALTKLEQIDQAIATHVFDALPKDVQQSLENVQSYEPPKIPSESTQFGADRLAHGLPPDKLSELFKDQSPFLLAAKQVTLSEALEIADVIIYVDEAPLDKNAEVWKQVAAEFRKQARPTLQEVLDDVPVSRRDGPKLKVEISNGLKDREKKYRFEFDVASGKLKLPIAIEFAGGKVYVGEVNVYKVVETIGKWGVGIYVIKELTGGERNREEQVDKDNVN